MKKKIKISKGRIPAATQLFTPDWIVKYMVENSLGRLWLEGHPNDELKSKWKYYIDEAEQEPDVEIKLAEIRNESKNIKPEEIKVIDPCMGSGHILVYIFDVLMQIYISEGYTKKDAAVSILENNLYGLDIDDRAYQLAYFAVMMKARSYNSHILKININPLLYSIKESNNLDESVINFIDAGDSKINEDLNYIVKVFNDAKKYGSILNVDLIDYNKLLDRLEEIYTNRASSLYFETYKTDLLLLKDMIYQAQLLSSKYDVIVTNPPYMGNGSMEPDLSSFLKKNYGNSKSDLSTVFMEKSFDLAKDYAFISMINIPVWMFISSYEKLRTFLINSTTFINMLHLGRGIFGSDFGTTSFVFNNCHIDNFKSTFRQLYLDKGAVDSISQKEKWFFEDNMNFKKFIKTQEEFNQIPGSPIAYWTDKQVFEVFENGTSLGEFANVRLGMATANNNMFLKYWFEVEQSNIFIDCENRINAKNSEKKWFPYNKGGNYRKWYGNNEYVVNWQNDGFEIRNFKDKKSGKIRSHNYNLDYIFKEGLTWSALTSSNSGIRYFPKGFLFDNAGSSMFMDKSILFYILGFLNSKIAEYSLNLINPTLNTQPGTISSLPIIFNHENNEIRIFVRENIEICKNDWDDYETSWEFKSHPFIRFKCSTLEESFNAWKEHKSADFSKLQSNEIELNKIFSEIYSIDIDPNVEDKHVSVTKADYEKDIKSFISYAVGCMFGRYDFNKEGLIYAGGEFNLENYSSFTPDDDNIIPVLDTEYFEDDIVGRFIEFVKIVWGKDTLEENLDFIANGLNNRGHNSRAIIRNYFLNDFFKDHVKTYQKCPIYWQFNSGKENGFNCLVYMHRYKPDLVARIRTEYLHKTQKSIEDNIIQCDNILKSSTIDSEKNRAEKEKQKLTKQLKETIEYDAVLEYMASQSIQIDLDDGVEVNYAKFQNIELNHEGKKSKKINLLKDLN